MHWFAPDRKPGPAESLQQARALYRAGDWRGAEKVCTSILQLNPQQFDAIAMLGLIAAQTQRAPHALELLRSVVVARPDDPSAHNNLGNVLMLLERFEQALQSFERALQLKPKLAEAHYNRANALQALGRFEEALRVYERALQLRPAYPEALCNRGNALRALGRFEEALRSYQRALQLKPDSPEAHDNCGNALQALGRFDEALQSYQRALQLRPNSAEAHTNLGVLHYLLNKPEIAVINHTRAIHIRPNYAEAYRNRAYAALVAGDFAKGWIDYEWRWKARSRGIDPRYRDQRPWLGREPLVGKTIVLHSEQGLGDTLQFCRYVKLVANLGANVILEVPAPLAGLLTNLEGLSRLVVQGQPLPAFDYHCPLMSLPLAFQTSLWTIPAQVPYVASDSAKTRLWKERLGPRTHPRVGLVWSGGFRPEHPELWPIDRRRNVPLTKLAPLRDATVTFYSLQKGEPAESELRQLKAGGWPGPELIDCAQFLHDFSDTAAVIENLDLVISVDTSTAHLAGALGKPVWIMNRFDTCWRWLLNRADSPWYPTARLYRQRRAGDWDEVVDRIRIDLSGLYQ